MITSEYNIQGSLLSLKTPKVMGIINVTPDSFFDGGHFLDHNYALKRAGVMVEQGVDIIDLGAESSRPNSKPISSQEEWERLGPALKAIRKEYPKTLISIDTVHYETMQKVLDLGVHIINDISAFSNHEDIPTLISKYPVIYILMHMKGSPSMMQKAPHYIDIVQELVAFFNSKLSILTKANVKQVWLDPGFGFGKTVDHNYRLLNKLGNFSIFDCPIMAGLSRKSMIYKVLETTPEMALNGTTALHMACLLNGASILRSHDVCEAKETVTLFNAIQGNS